MAKIEHYYTKFEEGHFYHVYNRSVDKQPLFKSNDNYYYFLKQYRKYLSPVVDTYAYSLPGNHFHLLIRIHESFITDFETKTAHDIVSHQFQKFFQSYAMAFNKQHGRVGTLFQTPFKRALITDDWYFTQIIYYIHANPEYHKLTSDFKSWPWSSYDKILSEHDNFLKTSEVLKWFGGRYSYEDYHNERRATDSRLSLEDET